MEHFDRLYVEENLHLLLSINDQEMLADGLSTAASKLGFDYFAYGMQLKLPYSSPRYELVNNYPLLWQQAYSENAFLSEDPSVAHCLSSISPIVWSESLFEGTPELWEGAKSFGLNYGWAQSSFSQNGSAGMLTLARSCEPLSTLELTEKTALMVWFNQVAHVGFQKCLLPNFMDGQRVLLTAREQEILKWTADGKTSHEISIILSISERTVNFHLNNIMNKLDATNKVSASVKAVTLGLI